MIPGVQVTIFTEGSRLIIASQPTVSFLVSLSFPPDVTPDTTADGAAGIFGLYLMGATPVDDQVHFKEKE